MAEHIAGKDMGRPWVAGRLVATCALAVTGLAIALDQTGLLSSAEDTAADVTASAILAAAPPAAGPAGTGDSAMHASNTPDRFATLDDTTLRETLDHARVSNQIGREPMPEWIADDYRTFRRIGRAVARLLDGGRLRGDPLDLEEIKVRYLEASGMDGSAPLPFDAPIDEARLNQAIIDTFNAKNGTRVVQLASIVEAR